MSMSSSVGYKPSPLGYGSPRSSPFRRPVSPLPPSPSPSAAVAPSSPLQQQQPQTTPTPSPTKTTAEGPGGRSSSISSLFTPSRFDSNTNNNNPSNTTPTATSLTPTPHHLPQSSSGGGGGGFENRTPRRLFVPPAGAAVNIPSSLSETKTTMTTTATATATSQLGSPAHISSSSRASTATGTTLYPQQQQQQPYSSSHTKSSSINNNNMMHNSSSSKSGGGSLGQNNSDLSKLQPAQVRMLRDGFQIMDRDSDGVVNRQDVADMLTQLGLPAEPSDTALFFPAGSPQTLTLTTFLNSIAHSLAQLSPASELLAAFEAFDDDDSGQIDVAELRDALLRTPAEDLGLDFGSQTQTQQQLSVVDVEKVVGAFSGRRAFSRSAAARNNNNNRRGAGEVFRYREFVNSVVGGSGNARRKKGNKGNASNDGDADEDEEEEEGM